MTSESSLLDAGERLLWSGRPDATHLAIRKGWMTFLFGIPFLAFALFWTSAASKGPGPFMLFGVPFIAVGLALVLSPVWYFMRGKETTYVLSPRRTIIDISGPFAARTSMPLNQIRFVELRNAASKFGDVVFFEIVSSHYQSWGNRRDGFVAIASATHVERLLRQAIEKARASASEPSE